MIAYADFDDLEATTSTRDYNDEGTATVSSRVYRTGGIYIIYQNVDIKPAFDFDYFDWLWLKKETRRKDGVYWNELFIEHFYRVQIALIFNTYSTLFNRRMMFPKSGFLARTGRKRRN